MANTMTFKIEGFDELEKKLVELGPKVAKKVLRGAVQSAANPMVKQARQLVPTSDGLLKKSLGVKTKTLKNGVVISIIGPRSGFKQTIRGTMQNPTRYAHLVEYGTAPHDITINKWVTMRDGTSKYLGTIKHPGSKPRPFLRPAFDSRRGESLERMKQMLGKGIEREATRK